LETDLIEVEEQFPALGGFQGLFVGGSAGPVLFVVLVEPLTVIGSDPPVEFGFDHVSDGFLVAVPFLDLHRSRDRVGLGELGLQFLLQVLGIGAGREPVEMVGPVGLVAVVFVLVERPVAAAEEPGDTGAAEAFFEATNVPGVLVGGQLTAGASAVGWHDAHGDNRGRLGFFLQKFPRDLGHQVLGCGRALGTGCGLAAGFGLAIIQLVRQILARLLGWYFLRSQPIRSLRSFRRATPLVQTR
jgi:hypothetical protein